MSIRINDQWRICFRWAVAHRVRWRWSSLMMNLDVSHRA
jgi:plasmid maintenance system killer protein